MPALTIAARASSSERSRKLRLVTPMVTPRMVEFLPSRRPAANAPRAIFARSRLEYIRSSRSLTLRTGPEGTPAPWRIIASSPAACYENLWEGRPGGSGSVLFGPAVEGLGQSVADVEKLRTGVLVGLLASVVQDVV